MLEEPTGYRSHDPKPTRTAARWTPPEEEDGREARARLASQAEEIERRVIALESALERAQDLFARLAPLLTAPPAPCERKHFEL